MIRETSTLTAKGEQVNIYHNLSHEAKKTLYITELYKKGCFGGKYFGKSISKENNPVRHYIACCMYKHRLPVKSELIDDCYNELFKHLQAMDATKLVAIYDEAPDKLVATALKIVSLKCFAIDPRYQNPRHSLIQSILFASAVGSTDTYDSAEAQNHTSADNALESGGFAGQSYNHVIHSYDDEPDDFERQYGFKIEDLIERLDDEERVTFYDMIGTQPRGKVSKTKQIKRDALALKVLELKNILTII